MTLVVFSSPLPLVLAEEGAEAASAQAEAAAADEGDVV